MPCAASSRSARDRVQEPRCRLNHWLPYSDRRRGGRRVHPQADALREGAGDGQVRHHPPAAAARAGHHRDDQALQRRLRLLRRLEDQT